MTKCKLRYLAATALLLASTATFAQISSMDVAGSGLMVSSTGRSALLSRHLGNGAPTVPARELLGRTASPAAAPTAAQLQSLTFDVDPTISRTVQQQFIKTLSSEQPARTAEITRLFESGVLPRTFSELLAKFGYSPNNLADVMTAYVILSWETVHNGDATQYPDGIEEVHQRMRYALSSNPDLATFSDARKQEFAETLGDLAMLATLARKQLLARGDAAKLRQLEQGVREATLKLGIDVGTLQLTDHGFVQLH